MYKKPVIKISKIRVNTGIQGETIETKFQRILNNNEPITDGAPLIYTDRKDGVQAGYDIRTDRFDIALDAMSVVHRTETAKRDAKAKSEEVIKEDNVGDEPIQANEKE